MWIIYYGLHSHQISTWLNATTPAAVFSTATQISFCKKKISLGPAALPTLLVYYVTKTVTKWSVLFCLIVYLMGTVHINKCCWLTAFLTVTPDVCVKWMPWLDEGDGAGGMHKTTRCVPESQVLFRVRQTEPMYSIRGMKLQEQCINANAKEFSNRQSIKHRCHIPHTHTLLLQKTLTPCAVKV